MFTAPSPRPTLWWLSIALATSCDATPKEQPDVRPSKPTLVAPAAPKLSRLIDALDVAEITSPLLEATDVSDSQRETILDEGFEENDATSLGWTASPCRVERLPGPSSRVMRYVGGQSHRCVFVLSVPPRRFVQIGREIQTDDAKVDLAVIETRVALKHPKKRNHPKDVARAMRGGKFVHINDLLKVHRFPTPTIGKWDRQALSFFTERDTRSIVIMVQDAESVTNRRKRDVILDNLRVHLLPESGPTFLQALRAVDVHPAATGSGAAFAKRGQLLPMRRGWMKRPPYDENFSTREALMSPGATTLRFAMQATASSSLRYSVALSKYSQPGDAVTFSVRWQPEAGEARTLAEHTVAVTAKDDQWHWHEHRTDLPNDVKRGHLELATRVVSGSPVGLWGDPIVVRPRLPGDPPNVVVIAVDTLRHDRLSFMGADRLTSPHLDDLAKDAVRFRRAYSPANWTSPAFASLFTGLLPSEHQVIHRGRSIAPQTVTMPEVLRSAGWTTHAVAYKAFIYNMGFEQGFERFFNAPDPHNVGQQNLEKAMTFLEQYGDTRFFLFLHFNDPHQPFNQPKAFKERFTKAGSLAKFGVGDEITISPSGPVIGCPKCGSKKGTHAKFRPVARDLYDGEIAYLDYLIGSFVGALKKRGLYDNTLIAFVADHGELMWETGNFFGHGGPSMADELIHVPMFIKPAGTMAGMKPADVDEIVSTRRLFPTLLEQLGLNPLPAPAAPAWRPTSDTGPNFVVSENIKQAALAAVDMTGKFALHHPLRKKQIERYAPRDSDAPLNAERKSTLRRHALTHLMLRRPGSWLVIKPTTISAAIHSDNAIQVHPVGSVAKAVCKEQACQLTTSAKREVTYFVEGTGPWQFALGEQTTALTKESPSEDRLNTFWNDPNAAAILMGPTKQAFETQAAMDADQMQTLQAMGYIE